MHTFRQTQITRHVASRQQAGVRAAVLAISGVVTVAAAGCAQQHTRPVRIVSSAGQERLTGGASDRCIEAGRGRSVLDVASSSGHLAPEKIRGVMRRQQASVSACFEAGLARHPAFQGKVTLLFAIEPDGRVLDTSVVQSDLAACEIAECLRAHFAGLSFPPPEGGAVMVQYPISVVSHALPVAARASSR